MRICGLKLTHDGSVALIDGNRLVFSTEIEKIGNNPRYTSIEDTRTIQDVLAGEGYSLSDIDCFVIDGWGGYDQDALAIQPRLEIGKLSNKLSVMDNGNQLQIGIAQYHERNEKHDILELLSFDDLQINGTAYSYKSSLHVTGHVMSAYCSSPFAQKNEDAYLLVWDGGMYPRLYFFDAGKKQAFNYGPIFLLIGNMYSIFAQHFGPFAVKGGFAKDSLSVAGKVMAYIALGKKREELFEIFDDLYVKFYNSPMGFANVFAMEFKKEIAGTGYSDEDTLCTFHHYLSKLLVEKLSKKVRRLAHPVRNLCLVGGCALNIKWNSDVRNSGVFENVYVPPFPNDSGSAIGAACTAMLHFTGNAALDWNVYAGPAITENISRGDWKNHPFTVQQLAKLLHDTQEPVVFLNGRAELGPRALGNRSILAAPTSGGMKDILNDIKKRELYRPVSPICLEQHAATIFKPGCADPYMLFDHIVKDDWVERIPAICHLDGSARLQTVTHESNPVVADLLEAYNEITGVPLLCNTSANLNGKGFFPDVSSAMEWNEVNYIWSEGKLYERVKKHSFSHIPAQLETLIAGSL
jgi:carbamoyltransferase